MSYLRNGLSLVFGVIFATIFFYFMNMIHNPSLITMIVGMVALFGITGFITSYSLPKTSIGDLKNTNAVVGGLASGIFGFVFFIYVGTVGSEFAFTIPNLIAMFVFFFIFTIGGLFFGIIGGVAGIEVKNRGI